LPPSVLAPDRERPVGAPREGVLDPDVDLDELLALEAAVEDLASPADDGALRARRSERRSEEGGEQCELDGVAQTAAHGILPFERLAASGRHRAEHAGGSRGTRESLCRSTLRAAVTACAVPGARWPTGLAVVARAVTHGADLSLRVRAVAHAPAQRALPEATVKCIKPVSKRPLSGTYHRSRS